MISINSSSMSLLVQRNFARKTNCVNTALERMSTGYKVNRAKDDAANLQISEKMTTGINACKTLKKGASTALDVLNTTEGILNAMNEALFRIRDLSLQKMNGVYDEKALAAMDNEIQAQVDSITQLSKQANFNGKKLLDGSVKEMIIPLYDNGSSVLDGIELSSLFKELDFIDVLNGDKELYFINANQGESYYADFNGKVFEIISDKNQQVVYRYDDDTDSIEFVDCEGVSANELGLYKNDYVSLGTGQQYFQMDANKSYYFKSGSKVYELKNTNAVSQIALFKDDGAGGFNLIEGEGVQNKLLYDLDSSVSINSGQALKLTAGSTQHLVFQNKIYEIKSTKNQTFIFNNNGGNLNPLAGSDGVTVSFVGDMKAGVTSDIASYVELNPNETKYYEYDGKIYQIKNTKSTKQNFVINTNNQIKDSSGAIVRTELASALMKDFSSYINLQSMSVTAGQSYYLKSDDGSATKITANKTGIVYFDKTYSGYSDFQGVSVSAAKVGNYEDVTLDSSNQFNISVKSGETKYVSVNDEVYAVKNDTGSDYTRTFKYDSSAKSITDLSILKLTESEAVAQGYTIVKTASELQNMRSNLSGKYILMNDIDMSGFSYWDPIGDRTNAFLGELNGNGFSVSNFRINEPLLNDIGLFGCVGKSLIQNLTMNNVDVIGNQNVGGLIGYSGVGGNGATVKNCSISGTVNGDSSVGLIMGTGEHHSMIEKCQSSGSVSGSDNVGGLVGVGAPGFIMKQSSSTASVHASSENAGGLVGFLASYSKIYDSFSSGIVSGGQYVGGIVGYIDVSVLISKCYFDGQVNSSDSSSGGALAGFVRASDTGGICDNSIEMSRFNTACGASGPVGSAYSSYITLTDVHGLSSAEFDDRNNFNGWDNALWDFSGSKPSLNVPYSVVTPANASFLSDFSNSTSKVASESRYLESFSGTAYLKSGTDIYEIKNNGASQDVLLDYDIISGAVSAVNAPDIAITKVNQASFTNTNNSNFSTLMNAGESQYMKFTINGVGRYFKVTNNSADKQAVVFEKTNNLTVKSGANVVIEEYTDMVNPTAVSANSFYVDFAGETKKNIYLNGKFYEISNVNGTTALFKPNGNDIIQYAGSSTSHTSKTESNGIVTRGTQYSIELDANETRYIKLGDKAFELKNNTGLKQTQVFEDKGLYLDGLNPNVTANYLSLTNSPMEQMSIITDYSLSDISARLSQLGAYVNTIEASIDRNTNVEENLTAAKSTIMDADMAEESAIFVQNQILQRVSSSILSQVNTIKRDIVLNLIR